MARRLSRTLPGDPQERHDAPGEQGENRSRILAGLFDAVCENVCVLLKPTVSPSRVVLIGGVSRAPRLQRTLAEFSEHGMQLVPTPEDSALYFEALVRSHRAERARRAAVL